MTELLQQETERLLRSWMRHDSKMLRDYLVADVEDPRINVQSILSRHFIISALFGEKLLGLAEQELHFACAMNWLRQQAKQSADPDVWQAILRALRQGADNAEGIELPAFLRRLFNALAAPSAGGAIPNYIEAALTASAAGPGANPLTQPALDTFMQLWREALPAQVPHRMSLFEPACGSANDYRYLEACGLARLVDYHGADLCGKNVQNARAMFPQARFAVGNVFEIDAPDKSFDLCIVHDLFEHLSPAGLEAAVKEICRVTRIGLCVGFFSMDEAPDHVVRPIDEYHWNTLSVDRMRQLFAGQGFLAQVIHIGTFLKWRLGCDQTHNPNAYTFLLFHDDGYNPDISHLA